MYRMTANRRGSLVGILRIVSMAGAGGIVHGHSVLTAYPAPRVLGSFARTIKAAGCRWVETIHDQTLIERYPMMDGHTRSVYPEILSRADRIVAIGEPLAEFLVSLGIPRSLIVAGSPLLPVLTAGHKPPTDGLDRFSRFAAERRPLLATVGAAYQLYDYGTILRAFESLRREEPRAGLVILNGTFSPDPDYLAGLHVILERLHDSVLWVDDMPNDEVLKVLHAADVFIRGAAKDSFGISRAEALMAGTPTVATPTGRTEFMTLYEHGDAAGLLSAARLALRGDADSMTQQGSAYFTNHANASFGQVLEAYASVSDDPHLASAVAKWGISR